MKKIVLFLLTLTLSFLLICSCNTDDTNTNDDSGTTEPPTGDETPDSPEDTKPEDTKPEDTKPEDTKPEDTKPEDTKPEDTKPEDTKPEDTKPEPENPQPEPEKPHTHTYSEAWTYDETEHWHKATCTETSDCQEAVKAKESHDFTNGDECVCGYKKPAEVPKPEILGPLKSDYGILLKNGTKIDVNYYPGFVRKALTFTIDDGVVDMDKHFLDIVRPAGIKGTFNLCDTGRLSAAEYLLLYDGYEVANHHQLHCLNYRDDFDYSKIELKDEVFNSSTADPAYMYKHATIDGLYYIDFRHYNSSYNFAYWHPIATNETYTEYIDITQNNIEAVFGEGSVVGFAYPHGAVNEYVKQYLKDNGYLYARDTGSLLDKTGFSLPTDRFAWTYNADHTDLLSTMALYDAYVDDGELKFFSFGVHASDYKNSWDMLTEFAELYGNRADEFYYATNREIFEYEDAIKSLIITEESITNPSSISVYITVNDVMVHLPAGATFTFEPSAEVPDYEITFEDINKDNLPKSLTVSLSSTIAKEVGVLISEVTKNGESDKVFTLTTGPDGTDKITVRRNLKTQDYTAVTFKADVLIDTDVNAVQYYNVDFKSPTGAVIYHLNLKCDDEGKIAFDDYYRYNGKGVYTISSSGSGYTAEMMGQWFTLALEVSKNEENKTVLRIFADERLVATCTHEGFYNVPLADYASVEISSYEGTSGTLLLDNISLKQTERINTEKEKDPVAEIMPVKGGANGIIVLVHDDGDITSAHNLDALYEKYGIVGDVALIANRVWDTVSGTPITSAQASWQALLNNGRWGLINHSMTHAFTGTSDANGFTIDKDMLYNEIVTSGQVLRQVFPGQRVLTFAYPGFSSVTNVHGKYPTMKDAVSLVTEHYIGARNYKGGVQSANKLIYSFTNGRTLSGGGSDMEQIDLAANGSSANILVFLMHQVWESGATGNAIPVSAARKVIERVSDYVYEGKVWSAHFEDALLYLTEAESAVVKSEILDNGIALTVTDNVDNAVYNYPLTVKVKVSSDWAAVKLTQGERVTYALTKTENGETYAYVDVVPDGGEALVTAVSAADVPEEFIPAVKETHSAHTYSAEWTFDENNHWHKAICDERIACAEATSNLEAHEYDENGLCKCGYEDPDAEPYTGYYVQNVLNGSEKGFDYTGRYFWHLCPRNGSAVAGFLENTNAMNADLTSNKHSEIEALADGNYALKIGNNGGSHAIPQIQFTNLNSADKNCFVFETDIQFNIAATNQVTAANQYFARISLLDTFGDRTQSNTNGYMPTKNDATSYFEFGGAFDTEADVWKNVGINGFNVESGKWYKMTIEYYKAENTMNLYFDGYLISSVSGLDAGFAPVAGVIQLQGQAWGSSIYVDNTYVGTVDKTLAE